MCTGIPADIDTSRALNRRQSAPKRLILTVGGLDYYIPSGGWFSSPPSLLFVVRAQAL